MAEERISICANCDWWMRQEQPPGLRERPPDLAVGQCRRHAPQIVAVSYIDGLDRVQAEAQSVFPISGRADWCGDYQQAERR